MQQNAQTLLLQTIEDLIRENEIDKAVEALLALDKKTQAGISDDIILVTGNYKSAAREYRIKQAISFEEYSRYEARARSGLLDLMGDIPGKLERNAKLRGLDTYQFEVPDNVRLEKIIGDQNNILKINWLEKALIASKSVCRVVNGKELGTGFITRDGYLFTNNHVIRSAAEAANTRVEFNYKMNISGQIEQRSIYQLDASDFIFSTPDQLDFARVKIIDNPADPLSKWGFAEIDPTAIPVIGEPATIIQHPKGQDMQIALNANDVISVWNQYLFYGADTEPGSSGSPVFNKDWKVVALHHAGTTQAEGGMQINAKGDRAGANRGILFGPILEFIKGKGAPVTTGISGATESFTSAPPITVPPAVVTPPPVESPKIAPATPTPVPETPVRSSVNAIPKLVFLYDLQDEPRAAQLNKHLAVLKLTKKITVYNVHQATGGEDVMAAAERELSSADFIFTLISSNIFNEDAAWLTKSIEILESGRRIIPVLVDKADIDGTGLEKLQSLPSMKRVVSDFPNPDAAWLDIVNEIKRLIAK